MKAHLNIRSGERAHGLRLFPIFIASLAGMALLAQCVVQAGGLVTNCTEANLRAAMSGGGSVTFVCDGTITLADTITNEMDTVLDGAGRQITVSGGNVVRLFQVATNVQLTVANLTLVDGYDSRGAAILNVGGRVRLNGVTLRTHVAISGGALYNLGGSIAATNCSFIGNRAWSSGWPEEAFGGAVRNQSGQVGLAQCNFVGNTARGLVFPQPVGVSGAGGVIHNSGTLWADGCTFDRNSATGADGCFWGDSGGTALGGAVCNSGFLTISRSTFVSNDVAGGNGLLGSAGGVVFEQGLPGQNGGNGGTGDGGALFNSGTASVVNCTIAGNTSQGGNGGAGGQGGGGAVHWAGNGGNGGSGGEAVGGVAGSCSLTNCTLAWNTGIGGSGAPGGAGGTGQHPGIAGSAGTSGGAWGAMLGPIAVNTLIARNTPGGNDTFTNAMLGALADNGGFTLTIALLPGSPAIDAGDNAAAPPTDQRGVPRPMGSFSDIGAYEFTAVLQISRAQENGVNVLVYGPSGQPCRLLTSTTLSDWQCVATNQIGPNGTVLFQDNCGTGETQRFYKVALP